MTQLMEMALMPFKQWRWSGLDLFETESKDLKFLLMLKPRRSLPVTTSFVITEAMFKLQLQVI